MKRLALGCFTAAVLALLLLPLFGADFIAIGREIEEQGLSTAAESYDRHAGFQTFWIDLYDRASTVLVRDAGTDAVLLGDGMLFFVRTLADYQQTRLMTDEEITQAADALLALKERLEESGVRFVFIGAPNKSEIYPEAMPAAYHRGMGESDLARLQRALAARGVAYVDALKTLKEADEPVYHRTDTHWNDAGALKVYRALLDALALDGMQRYEDAQWCEQERVGDLERMAYPLSAQPETVRALQLERAYRTEKPMRSLDDMQIVTHAEGKQARLVVSRDSFGEALFPLMANQTETLRFTRSRDMDTLLALSSGADAVIYELAQRNLRLLLGEEVGME